jgi:hypothetical protein
MISLLFASMFLSCIDTTKPPETTLFLNSKNVIPNQPNPLFVLDGVVVSDIDSVSPSSIEKIYVLKDQKAIKKYGQKGKYGVIEIFGKKAPKRVSP